MKDIPEAKASMRRKPATVVLIFDENSVLNLYVRLTCMRLFFICTEGKITSYYKQNSQKCLQRKTLKLQCSLQRHLIVELRCMRVFKNTQSKNYEESLPC